MNLIVAETREKAELALIDINSWKDSNGDGIFPVGNTTCWLKDSNIKELTDGRFGFGTVPSYILLENGVDLETLPAWFEEFDVVQIDNARHLLPVSIIEET